MTLWPFLWSQCWMLGGKSVCSIGSWFFFYLLGKKMAIETAGSHSTVHHAYPITALSFCYGKTNMILWLIRHGTPCGIKDRENVSGPELVETTVHHDQYKTSDVYFITWNEYKPNPPIATPYVHTFFTFGTRPFRSAIPNIFPKRTIGIEFPMCTILHSQSYLIVFKQ